MKRICVSFLLKWRNKLNVIENSSFKSEPVVVFGQHSPCRPIVDELLLERWFIVGLNTHWKKENCLENNQMKSTWWLTMIINKISNWFDQSLLRVEAVARRYFVFLLIKKTTKERENQSYTNIFRLEQMASLLF